MNRLTWGVAVAAGLMLLAGCPDGGSSAISRVSPATREGGPRGVGQASETPVEHGERGSDFGNAHHALGTLAGLAYLETVMGPETSREEPMPLIIAIHGRGDRPQLPHPPFVGLRTPVRVISPQAPTPFADGYSWFTVRIAGGQVHVIAREVQARSDALARFIQAAVARYPTRGRPIVTGFSQGGVLSLALAVRYPELIQVSLPMAGWLPAELVPTSRDPRRPNPPIRGMHSRDDPVVPIGPTRAVFARLRTLGYNASLEEHGGVGHTMSDAMNVRLREWLDAAIKDVASEPGVDAGLR